MVQGYRRSSAPKMSYDYESYTEPLAASSNMEFSDKSVRMGFIRKVYLILMAQLAVTFGMVAVFNLSTEVKLYFGHNPAYFYVALVGTIVCIIALSCCGNLRRRTPHNFIFLGLFTVFEGFVLGTAAATFTSYEILMAVGITLVVVLSLTIFAFQTKFDFTTCRMFVFVSIIVLFMFGLLAMIIRNELLNGSSLPSISLCSCSKDVAEVHGVLAAARRRSLTTQDYTQRPLKADSLASIQPITRLEAEMG
ncbi:protein lifeguard 1 isoform X2 [Procambarus clarkii]|uniref:protein lifeguard 1 isoform X2 n=1 Tax=Procambarus clarkii TaxID=6728 RepID=UPI00374442A9